MLIQPVPFQKTRWLYYISQGIKAFEEALQLAEGKDAVAEIATRQLLEQAKSTQQGKAELALAATKELAKEIQALKEHVLKATNSTITSTNLTRPTRKKTYAKATNTSLLGKSMHAVPP